INHVTGIPHSPTRQAVVERAHQTLKRVLLWQKDNILHNSPTFRLAKALFTMNFLNSTFEEPDPPIYRHFENGGRKKLRENPEVMVRDPESSKVEGP
ncbi:IGEB protein, partial [Pomatostomus ruficeps]|nr:IGEB protein [Pomatostomus ruficeps]